MIAGVFILASAFIPIRRLVGYLPAGKVRHSWLLLMVLNGLFIAGYIAYGFIFLKGQQHTVDLIVPGIFFLGSIFVLLAALLSQQTVINMRRLSLLEQESITDEITGVFNRRYLNRRLSEEFSRAKRYQQPLSILLVDLDHFKMINDEFGHQVGDIALCKITEQIAAVVRAGDILARYGGDEFVIIATNTTSTEAGHLAEQIRNQFESHAIPLQEDHLRQSIQVRITVSIGVVCLCEEYRTAHSMLAYADQLMYQAKYDGRNRVVYGNGCFTGT